MKVLFLLKSFPKLSETFILNQITGLIDRGIDVRILASRKSNEKLIHAGVANYRLIEDHTKYYFQGNSLINNIYFT